MKDRQEDIMPNTKAFAILAAASALIAGSLHGQSSIRCESNDGRYHECRWNAVGSVVLERQISDAECVEGRSWGTRGNVIWVDRGCRADFRISNRISTSEPWRNPALVTCESLDGKRNVCRADTRGGVTLARQLSDTACVQGKNWGFDNTSIWVDDGCRAVFASGSSYASATGTVVCESVDGRRNVCRADTAGGVTLARQLSDTACVQGRNWGYDRISIWVDDGCRAAFQISAGAYPAGSTIVTCESRDGRRNICRSDNTGQVTLARQFSDTACIQGRNWGYDRNSIWVDDGCRADFRVEHSLYPSATTVVCESRDGRRNVCRADTAGGVTLARQLSDTACIQGENWGYDRRSIWVDDGCRAEFRTSGEVSTQPVYGTPRIVTCESTNGRRTRCAADTRDGVTLVRRLSDSACIQGRSWGYDRTGIWVDEGCRAEFSVRGR